jgi:hypothetical protein
MPSKSEKQQKFFQIVKAYKDKKMSAADVGKNVEDVAKNMSDILMMEICIIGMKIHYLGLFLMIKLFINKKKGLNYLINKK